MKNDRASIERRVLSGESWTDFCERLKAAGALILREGEGAGRLNRIEGWRYLSRLVRIGLEMSLEFADGDFPGFYRASHETVKIGGDNPDNLYLNATIDGARTYRIHGRRGDAHSLTFGTKANRLATAGTMESTGELDAGQMRFAADGSFEVMLSRHPQAGNWLPMAADSGMLIVRQTFFDRGRERPAQLRIECLDGPDRPRPLSAAALDSALAGAADFAQGAARTFAAWARLFSESPNEFSRCDQSLFQRVAGDPNIHYCHGYWRLAQDEALVIDTPVPDAVYWNFVVQNHWMESLDYRHLPVCVNKRSAVYNADGSVTLVLAASDPGAANFLATAGHACGTMLLRWVGADHHPRPRCRVVRLSELKTMSAAAGQP